MLQTAVVSPVTLDAPGAREACVNCGAPMNGPYCVECGERRASDRDNSLRGFAGESFHALMETDHSLLGTLKTLLARPGALTLDYMRGRRVGQMRPLQLFLLVNVAFFLWSTATHNHMFDTPLASHMNNSWHRDLATRLVMARVEARHTTLVEYAQRFNETATVHAKTLIVTMVPAFALLVGLLHFRKRRFALEHLVFALHSYSAFLILIVAAAYALIVPMMIVGGLTHTSSTDNMIFNNLVGVILGVVLGWYIYRSLRVVYGDGKWQAAFMGAALFVGAGFILFAYRTLLFLTTFYTT